MDSIEISINTIAVTIALICSIVSIVYSKLAHSKMSEAIEVFQAFPSKDEMIKEIMLTKMPITSLPPEMQAKMQAGMGTPQMPPAGANPLVG